MGENIEKVKMEEIAIKTENEEIDADFGSFPLSCKTEPFDDFSGEMKREADGCDCGENESTFVDVSQAERTSDDEKDRSGAAEDPLKHATVFKPSYYCSTCESDVDASKKPTCSQLGHACEKTCTECFKTLFLSLREEKTSHGLVTLDRTPINWSAFSDSTDVFPCVLETFATSDYFVNPDRAEMKVQYHKRLEAVLLSHHDGGPRISCAQAARVVKKSKSFVRKWVKRYQDVRNVDDLPERGTARATSAKEDAVIIRLFEHLPSLTLRQAQLMLREKGIEVSLNTIRSRLHELKINFRPSLPKRLSKSEGPKRQEWARENLQGD